MQIFHHSFQCAVSVTSYLYCLLMCVASFLIFSELEAAGGKSFALRLIESSIDKVNAIDDTPVMDLSGKDIAPKDTTIEIGRAHV